MLAYIPGFVISWVTFPGVIIHEFAHKTACEWRGVRVTDVQYFSLGGSGYVEHRSPSDFRNTVLISTAPFALNSALAVVCYAAAVLAITADIPVDVPAGLVTLGLGWLGLSIGWHAIPSFGDTGNVWEAVKSHWRRSMLAALLLPVALFLFVANVLKFLWFDAIYALALAGATWTLMRSESLTQTLAILPGVG